jgi:hypothetical protein
MNTEHPDTRGRSVIVLHLTPAPGNYLAPPEKRLGRRLKTTLRAHFTAHIAGGKSRHHS